MKKPMTTNAMPFLQPNSQLTKKANVAVDTSISIVNYLNCSWNSNDVWIEGMRNKLDLKYYILIKFVFQLIALATLSFT